MAVTDRELLERAAKAAGYETHGHDMMGDDGIWVCRKGSTPDFNGELPIFAWMPLKDDSDALRLAVDMKLCLDIESEETTCIAPMYWPEGEPHGHDPYAATRRAIVTAAAALAKED